ncbi:hypothetical protein DSECCO2_497350 [anaerobic digester metagenome]
MPEPHKVLYRFGVVYQVTNIAVMVLRVKHERVLPRRDVQPLPDRLLVEGNLAGIVVFGEDIVHQEEDAGLKPLAKLGGLEELRHQIVLPPGCYRRLIPEVVVDRGAPAGMRAEREVLVPGYDYPPGVRIGGVQVEPVVVAERVDVADEIMNRQPVDEVLLIEPLDKPLFKLRAGRGPVDPGDEVPDRLPVRVAPAVHGRFEEGFRVVLLVDGKPEDRGAVDLRQVVMVPEIVGDQGPGGV